MLPVQVPIALMDSDACVDPNSVVSRFLEGILSARTSASFLCLSDHSALALRSKIHLSLSWREGGIVFASVWLCYLVKKKRKNVFLFVSMPT